MHINFSTVGVCFRDLSLLQETPFILFQYIIYTNSPSSSTPPSSALTLQPIIPSLCITNPVNQYCKILMMGSSARVVVMIITLIFLISSSPSISAGLVGFSSYRERLQPRKMVLGSKPPGCVNKCLNCRPCMADLVIPPRLKKGVRASSHGEDDNYYLLSWKCRCGDKLFQP